MNPQDLYHAVQAGANPHDFLLFMYRKNSGELKLEEIKAEENKKKRQMNEYTRKINLWHQKTVLMPIVSQEEIIRAAFSMDGFGRPCLKIVDMEATTLDLVEEAVELFHVWAEACPMDIILSPFRAPETHLRHFYHRCGSKIPYSYEIPADLDYDVKVRGLGGVSWLL